MTDETAKALGAILTEVQGSGALTTVWHSVDGTPWAVMVTLDPETVRRMAQDDPDESLHMPWRGETPDA